MAQDMELAHLSKDFYFYFILRKDYVPERVGG
jgi:hypothetical protein